MYSTVSPTRPHAPPSHLATCSSSERMYSTVLSLRMSDTICAAMSALDSASHSRRSASTKRGDGTPPATAADSAATAAPTVEGTAPTPSPAAAPGKVAVVVAVAASVPTRGSCSGGIAVLVTEPGEAALCGSRLELGPTTVPEPGPTMVPEPGPAMDPEGISFAEPYPVLRLLREPTPDTPRPEMLPKLWPDMVTRLEAAAFSTSACRHSQRPCCQGGHAGEGAAHAASRVGMQVRVQHMQYAAARVGMQGAAQLPGWAWQGAWGCMAYMQVSQRTVPPSLPQYTVPPSLPRYTVPPSSDCQRPSLPPSAE